MPFHRFAKLMGMIAFTGLGIASTLWLATGTVDWHTHPLTLVFPWTFGLFSGALIPRN